MQKQDFDLYLLCDIDLEWTFDPLRENPDLEERKAIFALYQDFLEEINANYFIVSGKGDLRLSHALEAIDNFCKGKSISFFR